MPTWDQQPHGRRDNTADHSGAKRGVNEDQIKTSRCWSPTPLLGFGSNHLALRAAAHLMNPLLDGLRRTGIRLHKNYPRCAPRSCLQAKRSRSREEIQAAPAITSLAQPVKECLANTIWCWAQACQRFHGNGPALPLARNNPQLAHAVD
jgi:hypothetical protein